MRRVVALAALAALMVLLACALAFADEAAKPWATVNLCDPAERSGVMGVRVGVPAGPGEQWMRVRAEWYDATSKRWTAATGGEGGWSRLGSGRRGVRGGTTFTFPVPAAGKVLLLRGAVSVEWRRGKRVRQMREVRTRPGHAAQAGGNSWGQCVVPG